MYPSELGEPLHGGVPTAVQTDKKLYARLALVDVQRGGPARVRGFAEDGRFNFGIRAR